MLIAGYSEHQNAFASTLKLNSKNSIILFEGREGIGKTTLLSKCIDNLPVRGNHDIVRFDFKNSEDFMGIEWILSELNRLLPAQVKRNRQKHPNIKNYSFYLQLGSGNKITNYGQTPTEQSDIIFKATDEWFNEYSKKKRNLLLAFDDYHKASLQVRDWMEACFLRRVVETNKLRVVIAGVEVPKLPNLVWGGRCQHYELNGVFDSKEWVHVLGKRVPDENPHSYLHAVCDLFNGHPGDITTFIRGIENST